MENRKKTTVDMTEGSIVRHIIMFALPLLGSSMVQQLYNTVDLLYVGNALGKNAAAAVGASSMMITCIVGLFGGLSVGCSVAVAKSFGSRDRGGVRRLISTAAALTLISAVVLTCMGILLAPAFIKAIHSPAEIVSDAVGYLRIYFLSIFFVISYNMGSGILRALGNARATLYAQFFGGLVNVIADGVFVLVLGKGVRGVAWATLFSQGMAALLVVWMLMKTDEDIRLRLNDMRIDPVQFREILRIGIPAGLQTLLIALSNVIAQYHINSLGTDSITAMTLYIKVELPVYLPIVAMGSAVTTFVGQNIGAGKRARAHRGTMVCLMMSVILTVMSSALLIVFGRYAFGLFNRDPSVVALGLRVIRTSFPFYFLYSVLQIFGDSIRGSGNSRGPMLVIMANITVFRAVLLSILVPRYMEIRAAAVTYPLSWFTAAVCMVILYYREKKRMDEAELSSGVIKGV